MTRRRADDVVAGLADGRVGGGREAAAAMAVGADLRREGRRAGAQ